MKHQHKTNEARRATGGWRTGPFITPLPPAGLRFNVRQRIMKTSLLFTMAFLTLQAADADDFTKEQDRRALQIERLVDYEGKITVYSLDPLIKPADLSFHGYAILGSADLNEKMGRERLLKALGTSIRESNGDPFACFSPRHGLRFSQDGRTSDIVICFQCESSRAFGFRFKSFLQTATAQPAFDNFLADNGVKLAEKPKAEQDGRGEPATHPESK